MLFFSPTDPSNQYDNVNSYLKTANETISKIQENTQNPDEIKEILGLITNLKASMTKLQDFEVDFQENGKKVKELLKGLTFHGKNGKIDKIKGRKRKSLVTNNGCLPKSPKRSLLNVTEKVNGKHQKPSIAASVRLESR